MTWAPWSDRRSGGARDGHVCGLYFKDSSYKRHYLPQVNLDSHTTISSICFKTRLQQTFHNPSSDEISHVRYTFPLYDGVAVNGYTISFGDETLTGIVKHKDAAKETYDTAIAKGETAGLLEALPSGIFGVTLGNLPPKTDVVVDITYCGGLKHDAAIDGLRYNLPTSIAPRYGQYPGDVLQANVTEKGGISITVDLAMGVSAIRKIQSPSHPIAVSMGALSAEGTSGSFNQGKASATLTLGSAELADDFVLQVLIDELSKPQAIVEKHPSLPTRALMTTLVPKFNLEPSHPEIVFIADQSGSMSGAKNNALVAALKVFLKSLPLGVRFNICAFGNSHKFLWPQSQAYNETNLQEAMSFVSSFTAAYGGTEIYQPIEATFEQRLKDLPLEIMLLTDGGIWGEARVFNHINDRIHKDGVPARVFALGIGSDVSHSLVEGVARAGNGFAQFVTQDEETDQKVVRMLRGALYPHTSDFSVEITYDQQKADVDTMEDDSAESDYELVEKVNDCLVVKEIPAEPADEPSEKAVPEPISLFDDSADVDAPIRKKGSKIDRYAHLPTIETPKLLQAPSTIPSLFPFDRTTFYLLLEHDTPAHRISAVTLRAKSPQGPLELKINVDPEERVGTTVHQLAARKAVQELEEGRGWIHAAKADDSEETFLKAKYASRFDEIVEREAVRLGEKYQVAGKWCSFVAVKAEGEDEVVVVQEKEKVEARASLFAGAPKRKGVGMGGGFGDPPIVAHSASRQSFAPSGSGGGSLFGATGDVTSCSLPQSSGLFGASFASMDPPQVRRARQAANTSKAEAEASDEDMGYSQFGGSNTNHGLFSHPAPLFSHAPLTSRCLPEPPSLPQQAASSQQASLPQQQGSLFQQPSLPQHQAALFQQPSHPQQQAALMQQPSHPQQQTSLFQQPSSNGGFGFGQVSGSRGNKMHDLIALQTFSGAWSWTGALFLLLGRSPAFDPTFESQDVMATALAVGYLEVKMKEKHEVWEMVVGKARAWMGRQVENGREEELIVKAKEILG